ncbi:hypothetical protein ASD40_32345 [Paenibacillus sp. Root444D2]|nr:hypothetical protein ASD40_32345 [Paenibacillus sp. Root444D2]
MLKKKTSALLITLLIFMQSIYGIGFITKASANTISNNILDSVTMAVYDSAGQVVTGNVYEPNSTIQLDYTWSLPNGHGYKGGDTYTFTLPQQFLLFNDIPGVLVMGQDQIGTFHVDQASHQVVITFNNYIESHDNVHGTLTFRTHLDTSKLTESTTVTITIPIQSGEQIFTLHLRPSVTSTIEKRGVPTGFNPKDIHWTVDVNKTLDSVQNAVMTDPIPPGLSVPVTVAVYDLGVHLDGTVVQGALVDASKYTVTRTGADLSIRFAESPIHTAYRIQYTTPITDFDKATFVNTATFGGSNKNPAQTSATVHVTRGSSLDKIAESYSPITQIINWGIKYNYNERTIAQSAAFLKDLFNDTQEIVAGSLHIYPVTFNPSGNETLGSELPSGEYTITTEAAAGKKGFKLQFNHNISSAYKINYQTKASSPVLKNMIITNSVTSGSGESDSASRPVEQGAVYKYPGTADYNAKTVAWNIIINRDSQVMKNMVVTDTFSNKGLRFIPSSIVIKKGNVVLPSTDYILNSVEDEGFTVKFKNTISEPLSITYTTYFNIDLISPPWNANFINSAKVDWVDSANAGKSQTAIATFIPRDEVKNNGFKYGAYNAVTKELTWTVGVNYNGKTITNASVQDTLESNQKFTNDSLKVYKMNIPPNGIPLAPTPADEIDLSKYKYTVDSQNKLVILFQQAISEPYYIVFKTSLQGQLINSTVTNTARAFNGTEPVTNNLSATLPIPKGGEYVTKSGGQSGDKINWTVQINYGQSTLNDAKIIDIPSINQQLLPNSFHLFATTVTSNGNVMKGSELTKDVVYTLVIKTDTQGKQTFELSFVNPITTAYILEYQSLIRASDHETVTNRITLSGTNVTTIMKETTKEIVVGVSDGSGTGSGVRGSLTVNKIDSANNTLMLSGAIFELYRKSGDKKTLINTLTTDETGSVVFNNLLAGDYVVSEITAPLGYVLNREDNPITLHPGDELHINVINTKTTETPPPTTPTPPPTTPTPPPTTPTPPPPTSTPSATPPPPTSTPSATPPPPTSTPSPTPSAPPTPAITPTPSVTPPPPTVPTPSTNPDIPIDTDNDIPLGGIPPITKPETLPTTGESSHLYVEIAGITLILLGLILRRRFTK